MNIKAAISRRPWILAVFVFLLVAVWMFSGGDQKEFRTDTSQIAAPGDAGGIQRVQVATLYAEPINRQISVYGRTAPARTINLAAEAEGRIESIPARRGERLKKGDPILVLDMRDRQARVAQANASVREHRTSYQA